MGIFQSREDAEFAKSQQLVSQYKPFVDGYARQLKKIHRRRKLQGKEYLDNWGIRQEASAYSRYLTSAERLAKNQNARHLSDVEWLSQWRDRMNERYGWARAWDMNDPEDREDWIATTHIRPERPLLPSLATPYMCPEDLEARRKPWPKGTNPYGVDIEFVAN